jgi:DNA-binding Lrp family transcriptional regulator
VVEEGTLRVHMTAIRRALREGEAGARYVESVTGRGYRFVAPVVQVEEGPTIRTTTIEAERPDLKDSAERPSLLAFVHVDTRDVDGIRGLVELEELPEVEEIHSLSGESAMLLKIRTRNQQELHNVLERMCSVDGFVATRCYIAGSTYLSPSRRRLLHVGGRDSKCTRSGPS